MAERNEYKSTTQGGAPAKPSSGTADKANEQSGKQGGAIGGQLGDQQGKQGADKQGVQPGDKQDRHPQGGTPERNQQDGGKDRDHQKAPTSGASEERNDDDEETKVPDPSRTTAEQGSTQSRGQGTDQGNREGGNR